MTTRAVSAAAEVQAQTIYRHFGDMAGLLEEVALIGFQTYLASKSSRSRRPDPVDDLRDGWDLHVEFGLENPAIYMLMYADQAGAGDSAPAVQTRAILHDLVEAAARAGRLRVDAESAAAMIHSAGVGVVMTLIGDISRIVEEGLSGHVREAILTAITTSTHTEAHPTTPGPAKHAIALRSILAGDSVDLSVGEAALLDELLARLSMH